MTFPMQHHYFAPSRRTVLAGMASSIAAGLGLPLHAATPYPVRPVKIVVPYAPGGATDVLARLLAKRLTEDLGQPFIVENKPGAESAVGASFVAKSPPDGYNLLFTTDATLVLNPILGQAQTYDVDRELAPIATMCYVNLLIVVPGTLPIRTFDDLVKYAKANRGKLSYGSTGAGGQAHLMGEMFKKLTGTDIVPVPYKSTGPVLTDVLADRLIFGFPAISSVIGFLTDGRLRALAISGESRSPLLPGVPTFSEVGAKDMDIGAWNALLGPAGMPQDVVAKLNAATNAMLSDKEVEKDLAGRGMMPLKKTPEQFAGYVRSERARMAAIVKASGVKLE